MPIAKIETRRSWPSDKQQFLIGAVHAAMMEALKIPERDRLIRFVEHRPEHFIVPPGTTENYTLVEISLFPGRSLEAKRNLYRGIVARFGEIGIEPNDVRIVRYEVAQENWGVRGGMPACDVDLGFTVNV